MAKINYYQQSHDLISPLLKINAALKESSLEPGLIDLVNLRASQMNGCAFCVDMHVKEAKIRGERELRLHHVIIWRESSLFSQRERAALAWTEAVTRLSPDGISSELFDQTRLSFSEKELSDLTCAIGAINFWNRLSISFHSVPGSADKLLGLEKAGLT